MTRYEFCGLAVIGVLSFLLLSCDPQKSTVKKDFPISQNLTAHQIKLQEVMKMGGIYKTDDYFVLRDIYDNAENLFYVYSYPDFKFLYSFCRRGNGPGEFLMPTVIKNMPDNKFAFRDHATDTYAMYLLTDTAAVLLGSERHPATDGRYCWEMNYIAEGQTLLKKMNAKSSSKGIWNLKQGYVLDTLPNTFDLDRELEDDYYTEFDDYWISAWGTSCAFAYFFIDRIEFAEVRDGKLKPGNSVGMNTCPDFYLFTESGSSGKYPYNVDNNIVYYETLSSTSQGVYALYFGMPWGEMGKRHSSQIEVYDWNGIPQKKFYCDKEISDMVVDEEQKRIYCINPDLYEDAILFFDYE